MLDPLQDAQKKCALQKAAAANGAPPTVLPPAENRRPSSSLKVAPPTGVPNGGGHTFVGTVGSADLPGLLTKETKGGHGPIDAWTTANSVPGSGAAAARKKAGRAQSPPTRNLFKH